jgi:hypothetical protein
MKSIHILGGIDGFEHPLGVDLLGEWKLDQNAVHGLIAIQFVDQREKFFSGDDGRRSMHPTGEAELFAGGDFGFDVQMRSGIFANQNSRKTRTNALRGELLDFDGQIGEDLVANLGSVKDACGHRISPAPGIVKIKNSIGFAEEVGG